VEAASTAEAAKAPQAIPTEVIVEASPTDSVTEIRRQLIDAALNMTAKENTGDADDQAARAREFQAQVEKHFSRNAVEKLLKQLKLEPITAVWFAKACNKWMYSTCVPGRRLPHLMFGPNYEKNAAYVPLERQLVM
jgi:hypothetical protein